MNKLFLIVVIAFSILSCETNNDSQVESDSLRVKNSTNLNAEGVEYIRTEFQYSGSKLSQILILAKDNDTDWVERVKSQFEYSGDMIIETVLVYEGEEWVQKQGIERKVEDERVVEFNQYSINGEEKYLLSKTIYNYKLGDLISWIQYDNSNNSLIEYGNGEIVRSGTTIKEYIFNRIVSSNERPYDKRVPKYNGSDILDCTYFSYLNDSWERSSKWDYSYSFGQVDNAKLLEWDDSELAWKETRSYSYTYSDQKLSETSVSDGSSIVFEYEKGESNYSIIMESPNNLLDCRPRAY